MSQSKWTPEDLEALGVAPFQIGDSDLLPAGEEVAQGLSRTSRLTLAALVAAQFAGVRPRQVNLPVVQSAGLQMSMLQLVEKDSARTILSVTDEDRAPLEVRWLVPTPGKQAQDEFDPGTIYLDAARGDKLVARRISGAGLLLRSVEKEVDLGYVRSPLEVHLADCRDSWVSELTRRHLAARGPLRHLLASGVLVRLRDDFDQEATRDVVDRLLSGEPDERLGWAHAWARGLSEAQRGLLDRLASEAAADLRKQLQALQTTAGPEQLLPLLHRRDDLEGARLLLAEAEASKLFAREIDAVDRLGLELVGGLREAALPLRDERLRRVRRADPSAWWVGGRQDVALD